jgi:hypothetical protein
VTAPFQILDRPTHLDFSAWRIYQIIARSEGKAVRRWNELEYAEQASWREHAQEQYNEFLRQENGSTVIETTARVVGSES